MTGASRAFGALFAAGFLAWHLPFLPDSLEDVDSINFALGIRHFDVAEHQPHPPGYPVFILFAKGFARLVGSEATALALLSVVAAALSAYPLILLATGLLRAASPTLGILAALVAVTSPLFWVTAARPLSDATGLLASVAIQAAIMTSIDGRGLLMAGVLAGLGAGVRSQVAWLTMPLLALAVVRAPLAERKRAVLAFAGGVAVWLVPLIVISGGLEEYWRALSAQGAEDFTGVTMLATTPTIRQLAWSLRDTFLTPWSSWSLAAAVLLLAVLGLGRLLLTSRAAFATAVVAFGPYLVLHLLFQETITTRYALPVVAAVAIFAAYGAGLAGRRAAVTVVVLLAAVSLAIGQGALATYATEDAPAFRMLADMRAAASQPSGEPPVLAMHRRPAFDLRRPIEWAGGSVPADLERLPVSPKHEWLDVVKYWKGGGRRPVWFVADPLRSDLALIHHGDPRGRYRWGLADTGLIGGVRPSAMDWFVFERPAWFLGEGWALTPETAGVATEDGRGPGRGGIEAWIRRTAGPVSLVLGGRNLGAGARAARIKVAVGEHTLDEIKAPPGFFLRILTIEAGRLEGEGDYARLTVSADEPLVAIEQFDAQPAGRPVYGFGDGWHEQEYSPATGALWRWTAARAVVHVRSEGRDLELAIRGGTNPSADRPRVVVRAGSRVVVDERVDDAFTIRVRIPAGLLAGSESALVLETDHTHVAADEEWRSSDRRPLGLRVYEWRLTPVS